MASNPSIQTSRLYDRVKEPLIGPALDSRPDLFYGLSMEEEKEARKTFASSRDMRVLDALDQKFQLIGDRALPPSMRHLNSENRTLWFSSESRKYDSKQCRTSDHATKIKVAFMNALPSESKPLPLFGYDAIASACRSKIQILPGANMTTGRLLESLPDKEHTVRRPVTGPEARLALLDLGIFPENKLVLPELLYINPHANNGYPVGGTYADENTHDAIATCMSMLKKFVEPFVQLPFDAFTRKMVDTMFAPPSEDGSHILDIITFMGKAKGEPTKATKILSKKCRFYNVAPRGLLLLVSGAAQAFTNAKKTILEDLRSHNAQGVSLFYGGAQALSTALDQQARLAGSNNVGFVTCGDDTWITALTPNGVAFSSLDVTNMDLTQSGKFMLAGVHAIAQLLEGVDQMAAKLWYSFMLARPVATFERAIYLWRNGCPSGWPLVSEMNGLDMNVLIRRLIAAMPRNGWEDRNIIEGYLKQVALDAHFLKKGESGLESAIRVEDHFFIKGAKSVEEALKSQPFLFLGSYFHYSEEEGMVVVSNDKARSFSQLVWSGRRFDDRRPQTEEDFEKVELIKKEFQVSETVRLLSTFLGFGIPLPVHREAHLAARDAVLSLAHRTLTRFSDEPQLLTRYDGDLNFWAGNVLMHTTFADLKKQGESISIRAIANLIEEGRDQKMWTELKSSSVFIPLTESTVDFIAGKAIKPPQLGRRPTFRAPPPTKVEKVGPVLSKHVGKKKPRAKKTPLPKKEVVAAPPREFVDVTGFSKMSRRARRRAQGREIKEANRHAQNRETNVDSDVHFIGGRIVFVPSEY